MIEGERERGVRVNRVQGWAHRHQRTIMAIIRLLCGCCCPRESTIFSFLNFFLYKNNFLVNIYTPLFFETVAVCCTVDVDWWGSLGDSRAGSLVYSASPPPSIPTPPSFASQPCHPSKILELDETKCLVREIFCNQFICLHFKWLQVTCLFHCIVWHFSSPAPLLQSSWTLPPLPSG